MKKPSSDQGSVSRVKKDTVQIVREYFKQLPKASTTTQEIVKTVYDLMSVTGSNSNCDIKFIPSTNDLWITKGSTGHCWNIAKFLVADNQRVI